MKKDSENISALVDKYKEGSASKQEIQEIESFLEQNPDCISEEGYSTLADKLLYEHTLNQKRQEFAHMMDNPPRTNFSPYIIAALLLLAIGGAVYFLIPSERDSQSVNIQVSELEVNTPVSPEDNKTEETVKPHTEPKAEKEIQNKKIKESNKQTEEIIAVDEITEPTIDSVKTTDNKEILKDEDKNQTAIVENTKPIAAEPKAEDVKAESATTENKCPDYSKLLTVKTTKSNHLQDDGIITVEGDYSNLEYSLDNESFSDENTFEYLPPELYTIYIKDENGCESKLSNIEVVETLCHIKYINYLKRDEEWQLPISESDVKSITIYNTKMQAVFSQFTDFSSEFVWMGTDSHGNNLPEGVYKTVIEHKDEQCIYSITIFE